MTTYPLPESSISLNINGVDYTPILMAKTLSIRRGLGAQVDDCRFRLKPAETWRSATALDKPSEGAVVWVTLNVSGTQTYLFGGIVESTREERIAHGTVAWSIACVDFSKVLTRRLVTEIYTDIEVSALVRRIVEEYGPELSVGTIETTDTTLKSISFSYEPAIDALTRLANMVQFEFVVSPDLTFSFFRRLSSLRPSPNTISLTSNNFHNLTIQPRLSQVRNRVYVHGGTGISSLVTEEVQATGTREAIKLRQEGLVAELSNPVTSTCRFMEIDGVQQRVGLQGTADQADFEDGGFLLDAAQGIVRILPGTPTPRAGARMMFRYRHPVPIAAVRESPESIAAVAEIDQTAWHLQMARANPVQWIKFEASLFGLFTSYGSASSLGVGYKTGAFRGKPEVARDGGIIHQNTNANAVRFEGSSWALMASGARINPSQYSIEVICRPETQAGSATAYQGIVSQYGDGGGVALSVREDAYYTLTHRTAVGTELEITVPPAHRARIGSYDHVVATWDAASTRAQIYVNGVLAVEDTGFPNPNMPVGSGVAFANRGYDWAPENFRGMIDEVVLYDYVISGSTAREHFASMRYGGVREQHVSDGQLTTFDDAMREADRILGQWANVITDISFTSFVHGWRPGDTVSIDVVGLGRNIQGEAMIQDVGIRSVGPGIVEYSVSLMAAKFDLRAFLKSLIKRNDIRTAQGVSISIIRAEADRVNVMESTPTAVQSERPFEITGEVGPYLAPGRIGFSQID